MGFGLEAKESDMLTKYARQMAASDGTPGKRDTIIFNDPECKSVYCRWAWWNKGRPVSRRTVTLNGYRWRLEWVD